MINFSATDEQQEKLSKKKLFKWSRIRFSWGFIKNAQKWIKWNSPCFKNSTYSPAPYFNRRLLNFNQYFESDADYIFFSRSVYEQHQLRSSINFVFHKTKPGTLAAGTVKSNFKGTIESFVAREIAFSFMTSVKGTPAYWKQFLYDSLAMVKKLGILTYFLPLSCADLKWEKLPYIIKKLNSLRLSDEELKNLSYLWPGMKYISKKSYLMVHWGKHDIRLFVLHFSKKVWPIFPLIYIEFQWTKSWEWSCLNRVCWESNKCTFCRPFEWSTAFWDLSSSCSH